MHIVVQAFVAARLGGRDHRVHRRQSRPHRGIESGWGQLLRPATALDGRTHPALPDRVHLTGGHTIMTSTEILAIYEALDGPRKQEIADHALQLIEEQRDERRTEQRI